MFEKEIHFKLQRRLVERKMMNKKLKILRWFEALVKIVMTESSDQGRVPRREVWWLPVSVSMPSKLIKHPQLWIPNLWVGSKDLY